METQLDYSARVLAANAMSASVRYLTQRNYLSDVSCNSKIFSSLEARENFDYKKGCIQWIKIFQVGRQLPVSMHQYFSTMQKILFSCHDPHSKQLIFLIYGNGISVDLYIGIRLLDYNGDSEFSSHLSSFIKSSWQGVNANTIEIAEESPDNFIRDQSLKRAYSFTGIPSFVKRDGEENLTSIDTLLGSLSNHKFAYLVIADPIDNNKVLSIINQGNEMAGQLESVKTFNFTDAVNYGTTLTESISRGISMTKTISDSTSKKNPKDIMLAGLLLAAGMCFAPAEAMACMGTGMFFLSGLIPQHSHSESTGITHSLTEGISTGYSEGQSQSLSSTSVNRHVEYVLKRLNAQLDRFEAGLGEGMWNTGVYLLTSDDDVAKSATLQLKSIISGKNSHLEPIRIHEVTRLFQKDKGRNNFKNAVVHYSLPIVPIVYTDSYEEPHAINNPFEGGESQLTTLLTSEELSCLVNFPQRSVPGISVIDSTPDFSLRPPSSAVGNKKINIGNLLYSFSETNLGVNIPTSTLTGHTLVTGVTGSGKTNTILNILQETAEQKIPFMVIEPAKTEYVDWAIAFNKQLIADQKNGMRINESPISIFIPGKNVYRWHNEERVVEEYPLQKLQFNPFEAIGNGNTNVLAHLDRIKATFGAAFPMYDILPVVMETVLFHIYKECLSNEESTKVTFPTMRDLRACLGGVIKDLGYDQRNRDNITAAMTVRINSLLNGWKKELFDNLSLQNMTWDELFGGRCIINLSAMGDDTDRAFVMSLLLQFLYEYRLFEFEKQGLSNELRHLIVIEEAHRVMSHNSNPDAPQAKCGQLFSNMLSEIREYGQGMVIVDQIPGRLIPDAIKNTNLKIIHRLIASDDIEAVSSSMGLSTDQRTIIPRLATGQAVISGINSRNTSYSSDSDVYWCKIRKKK